LKTENDDIKDELEILRREVRKCRPNNCEENPNKKLKEDNESGGMTKE
jgi:hypothetical protein